MKKSYYIQAAATALLLVAIIWGGYQFFGQKQAGAAGNPGGVSSGLQLWLKADDGLNVNGSNQALSWTDRSPLAHNADTVGNIPTRIDNGANFNPVVRFNGTNDYFRFSSSPFVTSFTAGEVFSVQKDNSPAGVTNGQSFDFGSSSRASHYTHSSGDIYEGFGTTDRLGWTPGSKAIVDAKTGIASLTGPAISTANLNIYNAASAANDWMVGFNGQATGQSATNTVNFTLGTSNEYIGANWGGAATTYFFDGDLSEIMLYNRKLTVAERSRVNSYLAIKYGVTLDQVTSAKNYVASDSTVLWDGTANATYKNNITGIARDDNSGLNQKQSKSVNSTALTTVGNGNTIAANNASNPNNFSVDKSALMFGDNNGALTWSNTSAPASRRILGRVFKTQVTGTVGSVKVQVPDDSSTLTTELPVEQGTVYLLTDADGNFSSGATETAMTLNGTNWEANATLTNGQFFTFATQLPPGSVSGSVFNDANSNAVLDAGEGAFPGMAFINVYDSTGAYVKTRTSRTDGTFSITGLTAGATYYLTMTNTTRNSATNVVPGLIDTINVRVEETYAGVGAGAAAGSGPICVSATPTYTEQPNYVTAPTEWTAGATNGTTAGPCYAGRSSNVTNVVLSGTPGTFSPDTDYVMGTHLTLNDNKHVSKVVLAASAPTNNVDWGFSADVVTNLNSTQGGLRQFVTNAPLIPGTHTMRYVPATPTNNTSGASKWWSVTLSSPLPALSANNTTLDGTAYSNVDGSTMLNTNTNTYTTALPVGTSGFVIPTYQAPEIDVRGDPFTGGVSTPLLQVTANNVAIKNFGLTSTIDYPTTPTYYIQQTAGTGMTVQDNIIGARIFSTGGAATTQAYYGIGVAYASPTTSTGLIKHNIINTNTTDFLGVQLADGTSAGNVVAGTIGDWTIEENSGPSGSVSLGAGTNRILIQHNALVKVQDASSSNASVGNNQIKENTLPDTATTGVTLLGSDNNTIANNIIQNSTLGPAVSVGTTSIGNKISQNAFGNNSGNSIDLGINGVSTNTTACTASGTGGANSDAARPTITAASLSGTALTVSGTYCATGTYNLEFYKAVADTGDGTPPAGEGTQYLGTLSGLTGGTFTNQTLTVSGLASTDAISATATKTTTNDTSEFAPNVLTTVAGTPDMTAATDSGSSNTDNLTNDTTPDFTGTCTTGDTLTLSIDGTPVTPTVTCAAGVYSFTPAVAVAQGAHTITAQPSNSNGTGTASSPLAFTIDTAAPAAPATAPDMTATTDSGTSNTDNITTNTTPDFTGTCTNGEVVTLLIDTVNVATQTCSGGVYTLTPGSAVTDGVHSATTTFTDMAGNQSTASPGLSFTIDTTAPATLVAPDMTAATDSGSSNTDNITSDTTPDFTGACTTGEVITLFIDGSSAGSATCAGSVYSITATPAIASGAHTATVRAVDVAGNQSADSPGLSFTIDTIAPSTPAAPDMTAATDSGASNTDNITSDSTPDFTGMCTNGEIVTLLIDTVNVATQTCAGGVYTLSPGSAVADGVHNATTTFTDPAGNMSAASPNLSFTIDTVAPATLTAPDMTAATDSGASNTDNITSDTTPDFTGACVTGDIITLSVDGTPVTPTQACSGSAYTITVGSAIAQGVHSVTARATDMAGNQSVASPGLSFTIDTTAPGTPAAPDMTAATDSGASNTDNITSNTTPSFTGLCTNGDVVGLFVDAAQVAIQTCSGGTYTLAPGTPIADGLHSATVTFTDASGNTGPASPGLSFTIDTTGPTAPAAPDMTAATDSGASNTDNITSDSTPDFVGSCTNGETVKLYVDGGLVGQQLCASSAYLVSPGSALSDGAHAVTATFTDIAGNEGSPSAALNITVDTTAPAAPVITSPANGTITNDNTPTISGTGATGNTISIEDENGTMLCTATVSGGAWTCNSSALADGPHTLTATQTDPAGNVSPASTGVNITVDTTAPAAPVITTPANGSLTNDSTPDFTGTAEANATVQLFIDGAVTPVTVTASGSGNWTYTPGVALSSGSHTVNAKQIDGAGNTSVASATNTFTIDTTAPTVTVNQKAGQADPTAANSIFYTVVFSEPINASTFTLSDITVGTSPSSPLATVTTFTQLNATTWEFEVKNMPNHTTVTASIGAGKVQDPSGNSNTASTSTDNSVLYEVSDLNVNHITTNDTTPTLTGGCSNNDALTIDVNGPPNHSYSTTCSSGSWSFTIPAPDALPNDSYDVVLTDTTAGGQQNQPENQAGALVIDTVAPTVTVNQKAGQADPTNVNSATFTITFSESIVASSFTAGDLTVAGTSGTVTSFTQQTPTVWDATITGMTSGNTAVLSLAASKVTDEAGNGNTASSSTDNSVTYDTTAPAAPVITSPTTGTVTNDNTPTISGTGENGATLVVKVDGIAITCAEANPLIVSGGTWTCTPSVALGEGVHGIVAMQTDPASNESPDSTAISLTVDTVAPATPPAPDMTAATDSGASSIDNITSDNTPDFTNTCISGNTIKLYSDGGQVGQQVCFGGAYTITSSTLSDGAHNMTVTATDPATNVSPASTALAIQIDTTAPATLVAPDMTAATDSGASNTDNITGDTTPDFTGACTPGTTINLRVDGLSVAQQVCPGGGTYSLTPNTPITDGNYTATVTAVDAAGNISVVSPGLGFTIDTAAPAAPVINSPANGSTTNDSTPTISGTGTDGSTVTVRDENSNVLCTATVSSGAWSCTPAAPLPDGLHMLAATQTDPAGNTSPPSGSIDITIDTTAPATLAAPDMTAATDSGASNTDNITNNPTPTFVGSCVDNDVISLFVDGIVNGTVTCAGSSYSIVPPTAIGQGSHSATVKATDPASNTSAASPGLAIQIDTAAPATPAMPDMTAATDSGVSNTDNNTNDNTPDFSGTCVSGEIVKLYVDSTLAGQQTCSGGTYTITLGALSDGAHNITATFTDAAGNTGVSSPALAITIDTTAPATPTITSPAAASTNDNTPTFVGTGEAGSTITVRDGATTICTTTVQPDGGWTCTAGTPLADGDHTFDATASDSAGNVSAAASDSFTIDTIAPAAPVIVTPANNQDLIDTTTTVTGTGETGAVVTVYDENGHALCSSTVSGGTWSCTQTEPFSEGAHTLVARQVDAASNTSVDSSLTHVRVVVDTDGISSATEDAGPNNGDGNGDGIPDSQQGDVTSLPNAETGEYDTVVVGGTDCANITNFDSVTEASLSEQDPLRSYPLGLWDLTFRCFGIGRSAPVTMYLAKTYATGSWTYKKFNSLTELYRDISSQATFGQTTVGGTVKTTITYTATDGGSLDEDKVANGTFTDPSGPSIASVPGSSSGTSNTKSPLQNTGIQIMLSIGVAIIIIVVTLIIWERGHRKDTDDRRNNRR